MPTGRVLLFKGPQSASRATAFLGAVIVALIVCAASWAVWQLRAKAVAQAHSAAEDHAFAMAAHASQALQAADYVAAGIARTIGGRQLPDDAALAAEFGTPTVHELLAARQSSFQGLQVVAIVDDQGRLINTSRTYPVPAVDLRDREVFQDSASWQDGEARVGEPVNNRIDGSITFHVARRIDGAHGAFLGMVLVGLSPRYFADFYARLQLDRQAPRQHASAVTLLRSDGKVMSRQPYDEADLGRYVNADGPYRLAGLTSTRSGANRETLNQWDTAPAQGTHVMLVTRPVEKYPLLVAVALNDDFYLAAWRLEAVSVVAISTAAGLVIAATFSTLVGVLRRRERYLQDLEALRAAAEAASQSKSNFLATVSHEVRTPLNGILGTADLLVRSPLEPKQRELAHTLLTSGRNLLAILNDILDLTKIEANELAIEPGLFSPRQLVHDVLSLFASYANGKGLGLTAHIEQEVPAALEGDAKRIRQVLGNLVSNAIKFSDLGAVHVAVNWLVKDDGDTALRIEVNDTGVGIPAEARARLFQPFAQADGSISRRFGGTGLGLAISRRLMSLMGGHIDFHSTRGQGTSFWIELPLLAASTTVPQSVTHEYCDWTFSRSNATDVQILETPTSDGRQATHVLVVEDNAINAMVVEAQLHRLGCSCDVAVDGEEAIQRLSAGVYDLVLMDCMLPGMSGFETTRRWRAIEQARGLRHLPVVALTANALASNMDEARAAEMDDFLTKPCTLDKLEVVIRRWLKVGGGVEDHPEQSERSPG